MSTVSLRDAILEARTAITTNVHVTDLVPARNITFGNSPQKDLLPRIVIEVSSAEYEATFTQSRKVQTFTVEYAVYSDSVDQCTAIMDAIRNALDFNQSSAFAVRTTDESFQAEVDNVLLGVIVATFQDANGIPGYTSSETVDNLQLALAAAEQALAAETAAWEAAVGSTLEEYVAEEAKIYYPNIIHMDEYDDVGVETYGPNGYQGLLSSGVLSPGLAPSKILHVAEVDTVNDPEFLRTLVNNNEFGNKHRFTYDDGTEATEIYSNYANYLDGDVSGFGPHLDGYEGDNPRYIIDHYTGLGWYRSSYGKTNAASGDWYESRGMYDHFTDAQDWVDKPSTFTYAGFTDWRRPTGPEWTFGLGSVDWSNYMTGDDQSARDIYFPPLNQYARGYGAILTLLGPVDLNNQHNNSGFNWYVPASQTNGWVLTGIALTTVEARIADGSNSNYGPLLCRRHYSNS